MKLETFLEKFELFAEAPNGVQKMRELILQLAVQGKLVPQDPSDEPASVLLEKIKFEKKWLIKEGKIKQDKSLANIELNEFNEQLPTGWSVERLGNLILDFQNGISTRKSNKGEPIPVLRLADIKAGQELSEDSLREILLAGNEIEKYQVKQGDILVIRVNGSAELVGRFIPCLISKKWAYCDHLIRVRIPFELLSYRYICLFANTTKARNHLIEKTITTAGQKTINQGGLASLLVLVPPLNEQKRIVAKVDQLMSLCDELEERQKKKCETRVLLNNVAINQLLTAREPDTFAKQWQRICNNFDLFYSAPENIGKLRQAILQLAVMGKLVPQDPNDEPASVLLEKIRFEKDKLVDEKKIPKIKQLSPIKYSDLPYKVPENWYWVKLGEITKLIEYGTSEKATELGDVPVFRMNNIQYGKIIFDNLKFVSSQIKDLPRLYLQYGDLLFNRTNSYELVGKTGVFQGKSHQYTFASYLIRISVLLNYVSPHFVNLAMNSVYFRQTQIEPEITQQCGQANFNGTKLMNAAIPLPPLHEQKRIVTKVDQLMDICDQLETKLIQSQDDNEKLMDVAVQQLLII